MDSNLIYRTFYFGGLYFIEMLVIYLYAKKYFPKIALKLTVTTFVGLIFVTLYSAVLGAMLSLAAMIVYLFKLRKPDQTEALGKLYTDNQIYKTDRTLSPAVAKLLGDKNWSIAEGTVKRMNGEPVKYLFCQGYTSSYVQSGQYGHSKVYLHYLAFVFEATDVSNVFKQNAIAEANQKYSFRKRLSYFFKINTDKPKRAVIADDGSFVIEYFTVVDAEHYAKQINWIRENMRQSYFPVSELSIAG